MPPAPFPHNEASRIAALYECDILDTAAEKSFDELTEIAAAVCGTPIALVSLLDTSRQWFKSKVGICATQTHRDQAFCGYTILGDAPLVIEDASLDPRTRDNSLVTGEPFIRFYAGVPLRADGIAVGTLCVIDTVPRTITPEQLRTLEKLARQVMNLLDLRRKAKSNERMRGAMGGTRRGALRLAATLGLVGLAVTALATAESFNSAQGFAQQRFDSLTERSLNEIQRRMNLSGYGLKGARGAYATGAPIGNKEFKAYVDSRNLPVEFPGACGFGIITRVADADLTRFTQTQRADSFADFSIHPAAPDAAHDHHYIVQNVAPLAANHPFLGWDLSLDSDCRTTLDSTVASGNAAMTGPVHFAPASARGPTVLYLVPVYRGGSIPKTPQERTANLTCILVAPIQVETALAGMAHVSNNLQNFLITDRTAGGDILLDTNPHHDAPSSRDTESLLRIAGRTWVVRTTATPAFDLAAANSTPMLTAIGGTLLSLLLAAVAWSQARSRASAFALAENMTKDLNLAKQRAEWGREKLKEQSQAMTVEKERLGLAVNAARMGLWDWNPKTNVVTFSDLWIQMLGATPADFSRGMADWADRVHPDDLPIMQRELQAAVRENKAFMCEYRMRHSDGGWRWILDQGHNVMYDESGAVVRFVGAHLDTTFRNELEAALLDAKGAAETALLENQAMHRALDDHAIISVADASGKIISVNEAFCAISGYSQDELIGQNHSILNSGVQPGEFWVNVWKTIAGGAAWRGDVCNRAKDGHLYWFDSIISPHMGPDGKVQKYISIRNDITARKAMEHELRRAACCDKLTGLCNRALFTDRLSQAIERSKRHTDYHFAVLFLDFDRFKAINDTLGHDAGDTLLKLISQRLRSVIRSGDSLSLDERGHTTARLGGDEFVVLLDSLASPADAAIVAQRLLDTFNEPHQIGTNTIVSTASIGICTSDSLCATADDALRNADAAMYQAKMAGKARFAIFDAAMSQRVQNRANLEAGLCHALDRGEFTLHYQPIVSLQDGQLRGMEALLRWRHPQLGPISPVEFIPIAEDTNLILPIGEWVLRTACTQFRLWQTTIPEHAPPTISVNLSRKQLAVRDLAETVRRILAETGVAPECLHLEITESTVMKDPAAATQMINSLRAVGVKIDLDDFGTGHSSLAMLHQFPIDVLKIDRSFVSNLGRGREFVALVDAIAQLARNMGMTIIAEGIESSDQLATLQSIECELGQGFLMGKPLDAATTFEFLIRPAADYRIPAAASAA